MGDEARLRWNFEVFEMLPGRGCAVVRAKFSSFFLGGGWEMRRGEVIGEDLLVLRDGSVCGELSFELLSIFNGFIIIIMKWF